MATKQKRSKTASVKTPAKLPVQKPAKPPAIARPKAAAKAKAPQRSAAARSSSAGASSGNSSGSSGSSSKWIKIGILAVFAAAIIAFFALGGQKYLSLDTIKSNRNALLAATRDHYVLTIVVAFLVYAIAVAGSVPGATILTLTCGFLFGRWIGSVIVIGAATLGATLAFLAARYLFADWARSKMGDIGRRINDGFRDNAFSYMLFLRLVPAFPFFLVNLAPALTSIPLSTYVLATAIGIIPGSFVIANLGETLGTIDSLSGLLSKETLIAFALLGVLALVPIVIKRLRSGKSSPGKS